MDAKTKAIVAYLGLIGWIVAIATNNPKEKLASYHIRQMLGLMILSIVVVIALTIVAGILLFISPIFANIVWVGYIGLFVLWLMGIIAAANEEEKPIPVFGEMFQKWFASL